MAKEPPQNMDVMSPNYFSDVLGMFYDNIDTNKKLYGQLLDQYNRSQNIGFSNGTSRNSVELTKVLASLSSNAISGTTQLFNAKKSIVDLEIKKRQQKEQADSNDDVKQFVLEAINHIHGLPSKPQRTNPDSGKVDLDRVVGEKLAHGDIALTNNEKSMKYDFSGDSEVVYDMKTERPVAVFRGTNNTIPDYPDDRVRVGSITRVDKDAEVAYCENGTAIRVVNGLKKGK